MAPVHFSVSARLRSFVFAARGLKYVLFTQHNAWLHAAATVGVVAAGVHFEVSRFEWLALLFASLAVWTAEASNTALELLSDAVSPGFHPLVGKAKDVSAGAVLICALAAIVVGCIVFYPHVTAASSTANLPS